VIGLTKISYNPDGMWNTGHHIFPEMQQRHLDAHKFVNDDKVQDPETIFSGDLYKKNAGRWKEMVADFAARLATTAGRLGDLGEAVENSLLNQVRADQLAVAAFARSDYRAEVLQELQ
jgi:hypothetical protein